MRHCNSKKSHIDIQCFSRVDDLPEVWDNLIPVNHFLSRFHLQINETASLTNISHWYVLIKKYNVPVSAAYFQVLSIKREHLNEQSLSSLQRTTWRIFSAIFSPKLLVAGHLFRHDISSFFCAVKTSSFEAYNLYITAINTVLKQSCASAVLVKDVSAGLVTYFQHYSPKYMTLRNDVSMELNIDASWNTINDYEKSLKHKYAQRFRKIRSDWGKLDVRELSVEEVNSQKDKIFELYKQVCEKQPARIGKLNAEYIPALKRNYPEQLRLWGIYKPGELIGFYSAWVKENVFDMFYIGFDYDYNQEYQLYFNILYSTVEEAIRQRKKQLVLGRTALDAKARLGCKPHYLFTFLYIKSRFLRMAIQQLQANAQTQEGAWEQRHPLKQDRN